MKALVTGGAGFMGANLTEYLLTKNMKVTVLDDLSGGFKENIPEGVEFVEGSVCDANLVNDLFSNKQFDYVYHLAAYAAEGLSHFIKNFNYRNNLIGSVNLINASINFKSVKCFVFTSSIAVYGKNQLPMTEDLIPTPEDSYGIAKYAVEQELAISKEIFGLEYVIFRPHNVYGEKQNIGDKYRNVIGIFMNQILQRKPITIFGDGKQTRAFSYIKDIIPAIGNSALHSDCYGQVFNVGADEVYTVKELAYEVIKAMKKETEIIHLKERNEVKHAFSDHSKAIAYFGKQKNTSLSDGLVRMAKWVETVGSKTSNEFENIEILKNLPESWRI